MTSTADAKAATFTVKVRVQDEQQKPVDGATLKLYNTAYREVVEVTVRKTAASTPPLWPTTTPPTEVVPNTTPTPMPVVPRSTTTTFREDLPPSAKG